MQHCGYPKLLLLIGTGPYVLIKSKLCSEAIPYMLKSRGLCGRKSIKIKSYQQTLGPHRRGWEQQCPFHRHHRWNPPRSAPQAAPHQPFDRGSFSSQRSTSPSKQEEDEYIEATLLATIDGVWGSRNQVCRREQDSNYGSRNVWSLPMSGRPRRWSSHSLAGSGGSLRCLLTGESWTLGLSMGHMGLTCCPGKWNSIEICSM